MTIAAVSTRVNGRSVRVGMVNSDRFKVSKFLRVRLVLVLAAAVIRLV